MSYERLVALAEDELALAQAGRWEELAEAIAARGRLAATLPARPPAGARAALERVEELQGTTSALLELGRTATAAELARLRRGRGAVRGYHALGGYAGARVDAGA